MALGHLDELQKAEKYSIKWSLETGFTEVWMNCVILVQYPTASADAIGHRILSISPRSVDKVLVLFMVFTLVALITFAYVSGVGDKSSDDTIVFFSHASNWHHFATRLGLYSHWPLPVLIIIIGFWSWDRCQNHTSTHIRFYSHLNIYEICNVIEHTMQAYTWMPHIYTTINKRLEAFEKSPAK